MQMNALMKGVNDLVRLQAQYTLQAVPSTMAVPSTVCSMGSKEVVRMELQARALKTVLSLKLDLCWIWPKSSS